MESESSQLFKNLHLIRTWFLSYSLFLNISEWSKRASCILMGIDNCDSTNNDSIDHKYGYFCLQSPIVVSVLTSLWNRSIGLYSRYEAWIVVPNKLLTQLFTTSPKLEDTIISAECEDDEWENTGIYPVLGAFPRTYLGETGN